MKFPNWFKPKPCTHDYLIHLVADGTWLRCLLCGDKKKYEV